MKNLLTLVMLATLFACTKKTDTAAKTKTDNATDSINAARTKYNDSIKILNDTNRFEDLSGQHRLTYDGDEGKMSGNIELTKTGRDTYKAVGNSSGAGNTLTVDGEIKRISEKHLNFSGKINQKINGTNFSRTSKTTFLDEGNGNFFRLQDKVNGDGFVDHIDIHK